MRVGWDEAEGEVDWIFEKMRGTPFLVDFCHFFR